MKVISLADLVGRELLETSIDENYVTIIKVLIKDGMVRIAVVVIRDRNKQLLKWWRELGIIKCHRGDESCECAKCYCGRISCNFTKCFGIGGLRFSCPGRKFETRVIFFLVCKRQSLSSWGRALEDTLKNTCCARNVLFHYILTDKFYFRTFIILCCASDGDSNTDIVFLKNTTF